MVYQENSGQNFEVSAECVQELEKLQRSLHDINANKQLSRSAAGLPVRHVERRPSQQAWDQIISGKPSVVEPAEAKQNHDPVISGGMRQRVGEPVNISSSVMHYLSPIQWREVAQNNFGNDRFVLVKPLSNSESQASEQTLC